MNILKLALTGLAALMLAGTAHAQEATYDTWENNYIVQALLGAVQYENLKLDVDGGEAEVDLSIIPQLGAGWGSTPKGDRFQYGLECSFLLGFMVDDISFWSTGHGTIVNISADMWMFDLAGGPYGSVFLDKKKKLRVYAAAGPLLTYANYRSDPDINIPEYNVSESVFGLGLYARTGVEFRIYDKGMLGLGVRGSWASVDLSEVGGKSELTGIAAFVSFTAGL